MERNPLHDLTNEELIAVILELRERLSVLEQRDRDQTKRLEEQARRIEELEKRNPTPRLDEAYSMKAEEKRQAEAQHGGKPGRRKQKSARRGRIRTAEKLARATVEEDIWPDGFPLDACQWTHQDVNATLLDQLRTLHLPAFREGFEETARQAVQETLSYEQYLLELTNRECDGPGMADSGGWRVTPLGPGRGRLQIDRGTCNRASGASARDCKTSRCI